MKFVTNYSEKYLKQWKDKIIDFNIQYPRTFNEVRGLKVFNTDNKNLHYIKIIDVKNKKSKKYFYLNKYHKFYIENLEYLPFNTKYIATKKVNGISFFLTYFNNKIISFNKIKDLNKKKYINFNYNALEYKYIISKYKGYIFEFKIDYVRPEQITLVNAFSTTNVMSHERLIDIANDLNVKYPSSVDFNKIKEGGILTFNYVYNNYFLDDYDWTPEKEYMLQFQFKNKKFLFVKISI